MRCRLSARRGEKGVELLSESVPPFYFVLFDQKTSLFFEIARFFNGFSPPLQKKRTL